LTYSMKFAFTRQLFEIAALMNLISSSRNPHQLCHLLRVPWHAKRISQLLFSNITMPQCTNPDGPSDYLDLVTECWWVSSRELYLYWFYRLLGLFLKGLPRIPIPVILRICILICGAVALRCGFWSRSTRDWIPAEWTRGKSLFDMLFVWISVLWILLRALFVYIHSCDYNILSVLIWFSFNVVWDFHRRP
jgi:hypothetical protein